MASGKSKYVVIDQNTYNNVGAVIGQAQQEEQVVTNANNTTTNQQFNSIPNNIPTEQSTGLSSVPNLYQQNIQTNFEQQAYIPFDNLPSKPIDPNANFQYQPNIQPTNFEQQAYSIPNQPIPPNVNFQYQQNIQPTSFNQQTYTPVDSLTNQPVPPNTNFQYQPNIQPTNFEQQPLDMQNNGFQNIPPNIPYQENLINNNQNIQPAFTNNLNQPIANEFIENQTKHVSADQLLNDYGLNNNIATEDDGYDFNIDNQISNSRDIIYSGPAINNNQNNQEIIINHQNLNYNSAAPDKIYTNSLSKKGRYIPPQRKIKSKNKPSKAERKRRRHNFFFNFILFIVYILIFGTVGYFGYNYWEDQQQFFFSREEVKIVQGNTFEETIYIKNKVQNNENYTFKSDDENIATIDKKGVITAVSPGKTTINVASKERKHTGKIEVEVISLKIKSFKLEHEEKKMYLNNTYTIVPIINGERNIIVDLEWKSSDENILTVSNSGIVTAHNIGIAEVTVSIPNTKHKAKVLIQVKK